VFVFVFGFSFFGSGSFGSSSFESSAFESGDLGDVGLSTGITSLFREVMGYQSLWHLSASGSFSHQWKSLSLNPLAFLSVLYPQSCGLSRGLSSGHGGMMPLV
jgi:hypothetical protein